MTNTLKKPEVLDRRTQTPTRAFRNWLVVLTILVLGMGAWIVFDIVQESTLAPASDVGDVVDAYTAAWNDYDGEAFLASTRPGYTFTSNISGVSDRQEQLAVIEESLPASSWHVEMLDDPIVVGDGPWYYVSFPVETEAVFQGVRQGVSVLTVYHTEGGEYLVANHVYTGR